MGTIRQSNRFHLSQDDYDILLNEGDPSEPSGSTNSNAAAAASLFGSAADQEDDELTTESGLPSGINMVSCLTKVQQAS
jgi:hypothetical protein